MNLSPQPLRASLVRVALPLLLLVAWTAQAQLRDLYMVRDRNAEFFRDRRVQALHLEVGDVVEGTVHTAYRNWLRILADGEAYDTRANYFVSRAAILQGLARTQADLTNRIERNTDRIEEARLQIAQLHSASAAIRFDGTIEYLVRTIVAPEQAQGEGQQVPPTVPRVVSEYVEKLSPRRAAAQAARWSREIDGLEGDISKWQDARQQATALLAASRMEARAVARRFEAYSATHRSSVPQPYIVIVEKTDLYDGNRVVSTMQQNETAIGRPNRKHARWLRVQTPEQVLDGRAANFASRAEIEKQDAAEVARLTALVADLTDEIQDLRGRDQLLSALELSLTQRSELERVPLLTYPIAADYVGRRLYSGRHAPRDAATVVNRARARALLRDWDRERKELADRVDGLRRRVERLRRDLAVAEAQAAERRRRLREADPAE